MAGRNWYSVKSIGMLDKLVIYLCHMIRSVHRACTDLRSLHQIAILLLSLEHVGGGTHDLVHMIW